MNRMLLLPLLSGCAPCELPESLLDGTWDVFNRVTRYGGENLDRFPAEGTPANGASQWRLGWQADGVDVVIDQQPFVAGAVWDSSECGRFTLEFSGSYMSTDLVTREFSMAGGFLVFGDRLEGGWTWSEEWSGGGEQGTFLAEGVLEGVRATDPESDSP